MQVHMEASAVGQRLQSLGLDEESITDVVRRGYVAFASCTANDPPLFPGFSAWAAMVRALREYLLPQGWARSDENNYSLVISPTGEIAIAVATGDDATGRQDAEPSTKSSKGPSTVEAVATNQQQLDLPFVFPAVPAPARPASEDDQRITWILLVHRSQTEVRCELSLPTAMSADGKVNGWRERIILGAVPTDPEDVTITPPQPQLPDIEIDVKRRA